MPTSHMLERKGIEIILHIERKSSVGRHHGAT